METLECRRLVTGAPAPLAIGTIAEPGSANVGQFIADEATVSGGDSPTGTVTFYLDTNQGTLLYKDTEALSGGTATSGDFFTNPASVGTDYWVDTYNGDANNASITSSVLAGAVTIKITPLSIGTIAEPGSANVGQLIADEAIVSGGDSPTGTVTFYLDTNQGTLLYKDTETLSGGSATSGYFTTNPASVGTDYWVDTYNGDANNASITSSVLAGAVTIKITPLSIGTIAEPGSANVGQSIADEAIVGGGDDPTGTVTFYLDTNQGTLLYKDTETLSGGTATSGDFIANPASVGTDYWVDYYNGDANNAAINSSVLAGAVTISEVPLTISTVAQPGSASVGQSIADKAIVSGGDDPTGTVTFYLDTNQGTLLYKDTETLSGGTATSGDFITNPASVGTDYWVDTYNGDANNASITSSVLAGAVTIKITPLSIGTIAEPGSANVGQSIADEAIVGGGDDPTGTVTFYLDTNQGTLLYKDTETPSGGTATSGDFITNSASVGTDYWVDTYNGDANNASITSSVVAGTVTISAASATDGELTGTPTANTISSYNNLGNTYVNVFDANTNTFFDSPMADGNYVQLDLGSAKTITHIAYAPRAGFELRMIGGVFEASNDSTFATGVVTLIPALATAPPDGLTTVAVSPAAAYEYVRYVAPPNSYGNIAELQVFGLGGATPPASTSTLLAGNESASTTLSYDGKTNDNYTAVFDGSTSTFWDSPNASGNWVQIDLKSPQTLTQLDLAPRVGFENRMVGGVFEASNNPTFSTFTTVYTVSQTPQDGLTTVPMSGSYEFIRYVAPASSYGNIAEMELYGPGQTTIPIAVPPPPATVVELSGTASGTAGSYDNKTSDSDIAVFDGNLSSFFDAPTAGTTANPNYVQFTLPMAETITQLEFAPRVGFEYRMIGGIFEVSNDSTFAPANTTVVDTLTQAPSDGLTTIPVNGSYQYIRYIAPANSYANIAELQVFGIPGTAAPVTPPSTPTSSQLTNGTASGTTGSYQSDGDTFANAFDNSTSTYVDAPTASGNYIELNLGTSRTITALSFAPRAGFEYRMVGGYFEASNDANFGANDTTTLYTISGTPSDGLTTITFPFPGSYQYVRYVSPTGSYGNIAEMQLFGY